ncbi:hypothetical protein B0H14DRAFT_2609659 [Mycena olivaceomarginata]|nr:hypothetical protein B0H14DRAFT_2609659 [Mycena olivaceomarginata]
MKRMVPTASSTRRNSAVRGNYVSVHIEFSVVGKTKAKSVLLQVTLVHSAHFPAVTVDFELVGTLVEIQPEIAEVEAPGRLAAQEYNPEVQSGWDKRVRLKARRTEKLGGILGQFGFGLAGVWMQTLNRAANNSEKNTGREKASACRTRTGSFPSFPSVLPFQATSAGKKFNMACTRLHLNAVLDKTFKVQGIENRRVVDISLRPFLGDIREAADIIIAATHRRGGNMVVQD